MVLPKIFGYIGVATFGLLLARVLQDVWLYFRRSSLSRYRTRGNDSWAFVSGASDGIGLGFAHELCERGFNVFLHGRNREKLRHIQRELDVIYPKVETKIIVFDATKPTEDMDAIVREIGDAHLTVLINNVGGQACVVDGTPYLLLENLTHKQAQDVININNVFPVQLTRRLLPIIKKNEPGLIINVSSAAGFGLPWLTVYAATKGFTTIFSNALNAEMRAIGQEVDVLAVIVGSVRTAANDVEGGIFIPEGRTMASASLDRAGCGRLAVWGYALHRIQGIGFDILPLKWVQNFAISHLRNLQREYDEKEKQK